MILGADQRLNVVGRTYEVSTKTLRAMNGTIRTNIAANRLSELTRGCVHSRNTMPGFGGCGNCPTATYVSVGGRIVRNVPSTGHIVERNSVMDISLNTVLGKCRNSGTTAFTYKSISSRTGQLVRAAGSTLCRNVGTTATNDEVNSVNCTVRECIRTTNFSIIERCINRKVNAGLRRTPRIPGFNATKEKVHLLPKVALTVRPVIGTNNFSMGILPSN